MSEELRLLQKWNTMLKALETARKNWEDLEGCAGSVDPSGVDSTTARAMMIACNSRSFEMFLPDLIRYWRTHGGFEAIVVSKETIDSLKDGEEKEKE